MTLGASVSAVPTNETTIGSLLSLLHALIPPSTINVLSIGSDLKSVPDVGLRMCILGLLFFFFLRHLLALCRILLSMHHLPSLTQI